MITLLDNARVERHGGTYTVVRGDRTWTEEELALAVGMRRNFLNQIDPIFLHIENLDFVFHSTRGRPDKADDYLRQLLDKVLSCNQQMLDKASDADDGATFAVEATQYRAVEGGHDQRGLAYVLTGIHKMADAQLAPSCGQLGVYNEGVNRVIGEKAGWDSFLRVFSVVGIVALALVCAPLGATVATLVTAGAGLALAYRDIAEADRLETLWHSVEDPVAMLEWNEVEMARLTAAISAAFAIFDVVPVAKLGKVVAKELVGGLRTAAREGMEAGVRGVATAARERLAREAAEVVAANALKEAVTAASIAVAMDALLPHIMMPVLVPWLRAQALEHGSQAAVDAALGDLAASGSSK
jgi:hypothetical protein